MGLGRICFQDDSHGCCQISILCHVDLYPVLPEFSYKGLAADFFWSNPGQSQGGGHIDFYDLASEVTCNNFFHFPLVPQTTTMWEEIEKEYQRPESLLAMLQPG